MKKSLLRVIILIICISLVAAFSLAGCKTTAAETTAAETTAAAVTAAAETTVAAATKEKVVVFNTGMSDPLPRSCLEEGIKMFNAIYPDIKVIMNVVPNEDHKTAIRAYLAADNPPDVMNWYASERAKFFIDKGVIMDIGDVWQSEGWDKVYPKNFADLSTFNGKKYLVPYSYFWCAVYYNKEVFAKYNLTEPKTYEEFINICETLKSNGVVPIVQAAKNNTDLAFWFDYFDMRINGPEFHLSVMRGEVPFTDSRIKKVFTEWAKLIDAGYYIKNAASYAWQDAMIPLLQGEGAMYFGGGYITRAFPADQKDKIDFFPFPVIDPSVSVGEEAPVNIFFASAKAPNPEEAKKWLAFLGSKEWTEYYNFKMQAVPIRTDIDKSGLDAQSQKGLKNIENADVLSQYFDRDMTPEMADKGMAAMSVFWDHTDPASIDKLLAGLEQDRQRIYVIK